MLLLTAAAAPTSEPAPAVLAGPTLLRVLDLSGILVFAFSGSVLAVRKGMDVFGVLVLALVAALGGGLMRDVAIGAVPPAALQDMGYLWTAAAGGLIGFFFHRILERLSRPVRVFDAAGLGLFVVAGTSKALDAGLAPTAAVVLGVLTGIGGGMLRDVLANEIPFVLRREIYAVAALAGALVVVVADGLDRYGPLAAVIAALVTFVVRVVAMWGRWHAPRAEPDAGPASSG